MPVPLRRPLPGVTPPTTYIVPAERTSPKFGAAFARGCHGRCANVTVGLLPGDFAAFCTPPTWPLLTQAQQEGRAWYYGDHAFYRRGHYYRITKNGYQFQPTPEDLVKARPLRYTVCKQTMAPDWNYHGTSIVICPNSPLYMAQHGIDAKQWVCDIVTQLARLTDRPIVIRWKSNNARRPLYMDLHDAWACIVFNSNAAVEAIAAGVPVFVLCPWATTAAMGWSDLEQIEYPSYPATREPFLWSLAEHQWSLQEIASGQAWKELQ